MLIFLYAPSMTAADSRKALARAARSSAEGGACSSLCAASMSVVLVMSSEREMSVLSIEFMAFLSAVEASGLVVNPIVVEEGTDESIDELRGDGDELEEEFHVGTLSKSGMDCACSTASSIALFMVRMLLRAECLSGQSKCAFIASQ